MEIVDKHSHDEQRKRVIAKAGEMFFERGIRKVRMDDVAFALGMSKRTLYEMFNDKEELLLECIKVSEDKKSEYILQVANNADNVLEIILTFYQYGMDEMRKVHPSMYQDIKKYPKVCDYIAQRKSQRTAKSQEFYKKGIQQGLFRTDINFEVFQFLMGLSMNGFLNNKVLMEKWTLAEVLDTVVRVNMRGICTPKGQRMLDDFLEKNPDK